MKKTTITRKRLVLKSKDWEEIDIDNNSNDKEFIETLESRNLKKLFSEDKMWYTQTTEWDECKEDADKMIISLPPSDSYESEEIAAREFDEYNNLYFIVYKNGYLKFYAHKKLNIDISVDALMEIFSEIDE